MHPLDIVLSYSSIYLIVFVCLNILLFSVKKNFFSDNIFAYQFGVYFRKLYEPLFVAYFNIKSDSCCHYSSIQKCFFSLFNFPHVWCSLLYIFFLRVLTFKRSYFCLHSKLFLYPALVVISISMHNTKPEGIGGIMLTSPVGIRENNILGGINKICDSSSC